MVSSNTSGLPLAQIAQGRSLPFRQHWLGTHFFNPPRYMRLVELIATGDTLPEVVDTIAVFVDRNLGKVVVRATVSANGEICARGQVVAVQMPETMKPAT